MSDLYQGLVEIDRTKIVHSSGTIYLTIPRIVKIKHGITSKNANQFHVRYFCDADSDDIIIRIEKLAEGNKP